MTQDIQALLALANQEAETGIDMNEAQTGGGGSRLLPAGYAFAQLVEYVELGSHAQEYQGKMKDPAMEVQLGFALSGHAPDPENPGQFIPYANDDGTPYIMRPYSFAISRNEKARAFLLFKALNYKGTAKNFGQLLGQKWLVKIVHEEKSKSDKTIVSRMDLKSFLPPTDPVSGQPYQIADAPASMYRLFLWNRPTKEAWDALYIEGQYEAKDGKPAASKNRIQEKMLSAVNFEGSALQALLGGVKLGNPQVAQPSAPVATPQAVAVPSAPVVNPVQSPSPVAVPQPVPQAAPPGIAPAVPVVPQVNLPA